MASHSSKQPPASPDAAEFHQRPWGGWNDWFRSDAATLKCMTVLPGARMSLQRHARRDEIWRILEGSGEDQGADPPAPLLAGMTYFVRRGQVHRIANTGTIPLVIVELQLGHCDEADIERLADDFGRGSTPSQHGESTV